jgi:hypothetical protein
VEIAIREKVVPASEINQFPAPLFRGSLDEFHATLAKAFNNIRQLDLLREIVKRAALSGRRRNPCGT